MLAFFEVHLLTYLLSDYFDHADCLAEVQQGDDNQQLDCLGVYPQVLPLAYQWSLSDGATDKKDNDGVLTNDALIYSGWIEHL